MKMKKGIFDDFPYADPEIIQKLQLSYKTPTTLEEKFKKFLLESPYGAIDLPFPIYGTPKNQKDRYWQNQNKQFVQEALTRFYMKSFREDVLKIAKKWGLDSVQYFIVKDDFCIPFMLPASQLFQRELSLADLINRIPEWKKLLSDSGLNLQAYLSPNEWEKEMQNLMEKYGLERFWRESIETLLLCGKWFLPRSPSIIHIQLHDEKGNQDLKLFLEIFSSTPMKEMEMRSEEIQWLRKTIFRWERKKIKIRENLLETLMLNTSEKRWEFVEKRHRHPKQSRLRKATMRAILKKRQRILKDFQNSKQRLVKILPNFIRREAEQVKQPIKEFLIY